MTAYISSYKLTSANAFLINKPASIAIGDLLIVIGFETYTYFNAGSAANVANFGVSASGQTSSWSSNISGATFPLGFRVNCHQLIHWKIADAHDVSQASYSWKTKFWQTAVHTIFLCIKGHNEKNPINSVGTPLQIATYNSSSGSSNVIPGVVGSEDCLVLCSSSKASSTTAYSKNPPSPWTEVIDWTNVSIPAGNSALSNIYAAYQLCSQTVLGGAMSSSYAHYVTNSDGIDDINQFASVFGVQIAINSSAPIYLLDENLYNSAGNPYADSTIVYSAKTSDPTFVESVKVGILTSNIQNSIVSESTIRSYRGLNPTAGAVVQVFDAFSVNSGKRFLYVKPNTDIYGLITNDITPRVMDFTGNTLATFGLSDNGSTSTAYKLYDSGSLSVIRQAANSNSLPLSNLSGATYQWYYATNNNQQGYYNPSGVISYTIPEETSINYYPSSSYPERKSVRCAVTYSNGSGGYDTSYTQWTPTNTFYYASSSTSTSQIIKGRPVTLTLNQYTGSPSTLYYTVQTTPGSVQVYASDFYNNTLSGTVNVENNTAIADVISNTVFDRTFYLQLRKDSTSGEIIGTSDNILNSLLKIGTKVPTLGKIPIISGTSGGTDWVPSPWQSIFSGNPTGTVASIEVPLGFNFPINGSNYTSIFVSARHYYSFGSGSAVTPVNATSPSIIKFIVNTYIAASTSYSGYSRVAKKVSADKVQIRFQGTFDYRAGYTYTNNQSVNEVTIYNPDYYGGVPRIEISTGDYYPLQSGYQGLESLQGFYLADGTPLCTYTVKENESYVLIGDATGTSWTAYTGYNIFDPVSYSVSQSATSVDEGYSVTFTINTANVDNGTILYYSLDGTTTSSDFVSPQVGSFTVTSDTSTVIIQTAIDTITESETFVFNLRTGATTGTIVASSNQITINDTSPTFSVSQSTTSINETDTVTFTVNTTNVPVGYILYYTLDGDTSGGSGTASSNDFTGPLSGSFAVTGSSTSVPITIAFDYINDIDETFYFNLRTSSTSQIICASSAQITINNIVISYDTITTSTTSVTEDSSMTFTVNTTNVPNGTTLYYDLIGLTGTLQTTDFGSPSSLTNNSFTITNNTATVTLSPVFDGIDDIDTFDIRIKSSTSGSYVLQSSTITINNLDLVLPDLSSMKTVANASSTRQVTAPSGVSVGDYLLIFAGANYTTSTTLYNDNDPGANAGNLGGTSTSTANNPSAAGQTSRWRLIRTQGNTTSDCYLGVFSKIADAHDVNLSTNGGFYVVNCYNIGTAADNQNIFSMKIQAATAVDTTGGYAINGSSQTITMSSITTTVPNALVMYFYVNESGPYTHTVPSGFIFGGTTNNGRVSSHWGYKTQFTAGATGSFNVTKSSAGNGSVALMIALSR
jgi:hypothetical protein